MEPASILEVVTAAVRIALKTYEFLQAIAEAQSEALELADRTKTIHLLTQCIQKRLDEGSTRRRLDRSTSIVVDRSLKACRKCLIQLQMKVRGCAPGEQITISSRIAHGFRWTFTKGGRQILLANLDTAIRDLQLPVTLLEQAKHGVTQDLIKKLAENVAEGFAHLNGPPDYLSIPGLDGSTNRRPSHSAIGIQDEDGKCFEVYRSLQMNLDDAKTISTAQSNPASDTRSSLPGNGRELNSRNLAMNNRTLGVEVEDSIVPDNDLLGLEADMGQIEVAHTPTHPLLLKEFFKATLDRANQALDAQKFSLAEEHLDSALRLGRELEERDDQSFPERRDTELKLIFVYEQQKRYAKAVAKLNVVLSSLSRDVSDQEDLEIARIDIMCARNQYLMSRSARADGNLDHADSNLALADKYIISTLSKLMTLEEKGVIKHDDIAIIECAKLAIDILEANHNSARAQVIRKLYLGQVEEMPGTVPVRILQDEELRRVGTSSSIASFMTVPTISDVNRSNEANLPALSNAIVSDDLEGAQTVLAQLEPHSSSLDERCTIRGWTPLMYAAACEHSNRGKSEPCRNCLQLFTSIAEKGADLNAVEVRPTQSRSRHVPTTVLHQVCKRGDTNMVQHLVRMDIDIDTCTPHTALVVATKERKVDIVRILLDHQAKVMTWDSHRHTPYHHAVMNADLDCLSLLIKALPSRTARSGNVPATDELDPITATDDTSACDYSYLSLRDNSGKTPLHWATSRSGQDQIWYQLATLLLEEGADPNILDNAHQTPLTLAAQEPRPTPEAIRMLKLLLSHGADPTLGSINARRYFRNYQSRDGLSSLSASNRDVAVNQHRRRDSNMSRSSHASGSTNDGTRIIAANQGIRRDSHVSMSTDETVGGAQAKRTGTGFLSRFRSGGSR